MRAALDRGAPDGARPPRSRRRRSALLARARVRALEATVPHAQLAAPAGAPPLGAARDRSRSTPATPARSRSRSPARSPRRSAGSPPSPGSGSCRGRCTSAATDGRIHNTALVLSPDGRARRDATARSSPGSRTRHARRATRFVTFDIPEVGRVGLPICYDGSFPETFRQLAWMGAEVVLQPSLTTTSDREPGARDGARQRDLQPALRRRR